MRISLLMIVGALVAAGCTKPKPGDRLWAAEGVYVEKDFGLVRDHSEPAGVRILEDMLRAAEEASPKDIPRIAAIRGRLADLRAAMDFPTEFSRSLLPDDHLFRVQTKNRRITYIVAVRDEKIVARAQPRILSDQERIIRN